MVRLRGALAAICAFLVAGGSPINPLRPHLARCGVHRVAVLLVGHSAPKGFERHMDVFERYVVAPLDPDVYAVTDANGPPVLRGEPMHEALPRALGARLKGLGLTISSTPELEAAARLANSPPPELEAFMRHATLTTEAAVQALVGERRFNSTSFVSVSPAPDSDAQWFKVREAWKLMERHEEQQGFRYDVVLKLRFDCTPADGAFDVCETSDAVPAPLIAGRRGFRAIHACTDHAF